MPFRILWTANALERVVEIGDFIALRNPNAAANVVERLFGRVELLADNPRSAPQWPRGADPDIRQLVVDNYIVIYRVVDAEQRITVLTVRHGRQRPLEPEDLG